MSLNSSIRLVRPTIWRHGGPLQVDAKLAKRRTEAPNECVTYPFPKRTKAAPFFDLVVISGDHPWEKPAPEIYSFIAEKFGLASFSDAVMIGDNWDTDMKGGINASVKALIWIRPKDLDTSDEDEARLAAEFSGVCLKTTDVLDVPSLVGKIYSQ